VDEWYLEKGEDEIERCYLVFFLWLYVFNVFQKKRKRGRER